MASDWSLESVLPIRSGSTYLGYQPTKNVKYFLYSIDSRVQVRVLVILSYSCLYCLCYLCCLWQLCYLCYLLQFTLFVLFGVGMILGKPTGSPSSWMSAASQPAFPPDIWVPGPNDRGVRRSHPKSGPRWFSIGFSCSKGAIGQKRILSIGSWKKACCTCMTQMLAEIEY